MRQTVSGHVGIAISYQPFWTFVTCNVPSQYKFPDNFLFFVSVLMIGFPVAIWLSLSSAIFSNCSLRSSQLTVLIAFCIFLFWIRVFSKAVWQYFYLHQLLFLWVCQQFASRPGLSVWLSHPSDRQQYNCCKTSENFSSVPGMLSMPRFRPLPVVRCPHKQSFGQHLKCLQHSLPPQANFKASVAAYDLLFFSERSL